MPAYKRKPREGLTHDSDCFELAPDEYNSPRNDTDLKEELDLVVNHIKRLARSASLEFAINVGALIIHHFYDGDPQAWRSRGPKVSSFRRLAQHPELPLSAGSLYRCVALFELCERLNAPTRWQHLGASHLRLVLHLPAERQEGLLATANANRWTVKVLQQQVLAQRPTRPSFGGRYPDPPIAKSLKNVKRSLKEHQLLVDQTDRLSSQDLEESIRLLDETRRTLEHLSLSLLARTTDTPSEGVVAQA